MALPAQGNIAVAGVGGQGVILASDIIADLCLQHGYDVKKTEVHGMSVRGGAVSCQVRFGPEVHNVVIEKGRLNHIVGLEWAEALRWLPLLAQDGSVFVSSEIIVPPLSHQDRVTGDVKYPLEFAHDDRVRAIDAETMARRAGNAKTAGIVLLGALSTELAFPAADWTETIRRLVPAQAVEANLRAFAAGRAFRQAEPPAQVARPPLALARYELRIRPEWCKSCGICVDVCPEHIWQLDELEIARPTNHAERCTGCDLCEKLCPDFAIDVVHLARAQAAQRPQGGAA